MLPCTLIALAAGCAEPLEFPDWTIPVADGTAVHGHAPVADEDRVGARVGLVEDLVIGERGDDMNYAFGVLSPRVAVDAGGNIYVLDGSAARVQAFDPRGEYRFTIGREGQGPGEFGRPQLLTVAGDQVVVFDSRNNRFSRFDVDGSHVEDQVSESLAAYVSLAGNPDGSLLASRLQRGSGADEERRLEVVRVDADGRPLGAMLRATWPEGISYRGESGGRTLTVGFSLTPQPELVAAPGAPLYFSALDEYQVVSFDPDGETRWALRVAAPRPPLPYSRIEWGMSILERRFPNVRESEIDWPEQNYALSGIEVDGHGHLYVYPMAEVEADEPRPVDVYSVDGERLFAGTMRLYDWDVAVGDFVYGSDRDDNGEWQVVRYRLDEPFQP